MIAPKLCLFPQNNSLFAAAGRRSSIPIAAGGCERQGACIAANALKGAQRG
jgi:hypothetical protein